MGFRNPQEKLEKKCYITCKNHYACYRAYVTVTNSFGDQISRQLKYMLQSVSEISGDFLYINLSIRLLKISITD